MKKKRHRPRQKRRSVVLDVFTQGDLKEWINRGNEVQSLSDRVYFDLERQRVSRYEDLCTALRSHPGIALELRGWTRVVDWRWSQTPLSGVGSLNGIGGRFNIGVDLDRARGQSFRALYVAENVETAYAEYFGGDLSSKTNRLSLGEFALRRETSFTTFLLSGQLEQILDLRTVESIQAFAAIIQGFDISPATKAAIRRARLPPRAVMRTAAALRNRLLVSPSEWRLEPQAYGIPAACQIFGRFVRDAGFDGILFPSQQGLGGNLALYPENFRAGSSRIEVVGSAPEGATNTILDKDHL
jgi:hypothetical protein